MDKDKEAAFLTELAALSKKYNIIVGGCGECGSPWIVERRPDYQAEWHSDLKWHEDTESYTHE